MTLRPVVPPYLNIVNGITVNEDALCLSPLEGALFMDAFFELYCLLGHYLSDIVYRGMSWLTLFIEAYSHWNCLFGHFLAATVNMSTVYRHILRLCKLGKWGCSVHHYGSVGNI